MMTDLMTVERERFHIPVGSLSFKSQFTGIYLSRLKAARITLESKARCRWDTSLPMKYLADLTDSEECIVIGNIFRESELKPSVIKQLAELDLIGGDDDDCANGLPCSSKHKEGCNFDRLASGEDAIFLEDEVQRIRLITTKNGANVDGQGTMHWLQERLVTGVVIALRGFEEESSPGIFNVIDAIFLEPQPEHPITTANAQSPSSPFDLNSGQWVAFVSGLGFTGSGHVHHASHSLALRLLADYLRCTNLKRLFVLGDSIQIGDPAGSELFLQARFLNRKGDVDSVTAMTEFDSWLAELPLSGGIDGVARDEGDSRGLQVELLPGPSDCVSQLLPQQPFHPVLFPKAVARAGGRVGVGCGLLSSTNPCITRVADRRILATSGQTVTDVYRYTQSGDVLDCMESLLLWGHLAPTCPDTLNGYPFTHSRDPLLINSSSDYPDVFVTGNQSSAMWRRARLTASSSCNDSAQGALLLSVPRFDKTQTVVLLELGSLKCYPLRFDLSEL